MAETALALENLGKRGEPEQARPLLEKLEKELARLALYIQDVDLR